MYKVGEAFHDWFWWGVEKSSNAYNSFFSYVNNNSPVVSTEVAKRDQDNVQDDPQFALSYYFCEKYLAAKDKFQ